MNRRAPRYLATGTIGLLAAAMVGGCGEVPQPAGNESAAEATETGQSTSGGLSESEIASLAKTQKVCAVTGEPLGSMGDPVPVSVTDSSGQSHTVLLCCDSCEGTLKEDPDKYLAKLNEAPNEDSEQPGT